MLKTLLTILRGNVGRLADAVGDRNSLVVLDQQMRDAGLALQRAKKALALAMAQDRQEGVRLDGVLAQVADLEARIVEALAAGDDLLAREGAEAVCQLEAERDAVSTARSLFSTEIARLRGHVVQGESRLAALDRGRRIARASQAVRDMRRGGFEASLPHEGTLAEAEANLRRLRERQVEAQAADDALEMLDAANGPLAAAEKLAAQGFGPRTKPTADDVLARLKGRKAA